MGPTARLTIETEDLDDADRAVGPWRRSHRAVADEAALLTHLAQSNVPRVDAEVLRDRVVDWAFEGSHPIVVRIREIEVHPRHSIGVHLSAGDQGAVER